MPSPFPGMDPYLEPHWLDVHAALIIEARRALNRSLPGALVARVAERVVIESGEEGFHRVGPDVRVFSPSTSDPREGEVGIVIDAPYKLVIERDPLIERFIRVHDESDQLITVIEFISPTNKRAPGLEDFRRKRAELLAAGAYVVEVDLVRAGNWRALMRPASCPPEAVSTYRAVVRTSGRRPGGYLFPIASTEPLPVVPIPLRPKDQPVRLALQPLLDTVYDDGRYDRTLDYSRPPDPPLEAGDAARAEQWLEKKGRRKKTPEETA